MLEGRRGDYTGMGGIDFGQFDNENRQEFNPHRIDDLKRSLNGCVLEFLQWLFPEGKLKGHEYTIGTIEGGVGKSTSFNVLAGKEGVGGDFATGDFTGDLIDVYCKATGKSFKEALPELEEWTGIPAVKEASENPDILNIPTLLPADFDIHSVPKSQITFYTYKDYDLNTLLTIKRVSHSSGKKSFYPEFPDGSKKIPEDFVRPLYNLPGINGASTVIVVEGEKCADYLNSLGLVATTSIGGAAIPPEKTDWNPLEGKVVVLWPDNDDAGVKHQKRILERLKKLGVRKIRLVKPPRNVDEKWDAANCEPKLIKKLLSAAKVIYRPIDIMTEEFSAKSYDEHPPKREFLIDGGFGLNSCSILAAEGGTGKSFMFLDLAIKVAFGTIYQEEAFGGQIQQSGSVVYFSAEDGRPDIHERINLVDIGNPPRRFKNTPNELRIIPMPSLGVTFPLFYMRDGILTESDNWSSIRESILEMDNLKLIILDPLSMLVHADVNADPSMGSLIMAEFNRLAVETNSAVLISHHFSKGNYDAPIDTPEKARQHVRGTTALVDSARNVFCIWKATKTQATESLANLGEEYQRNKIFYGATVKSNYLTEDSIKTFKRDYTGVLVCIEKNYDSSKNKSDNSLNEEIKRIIAKRSLEGRPVTLKGEDKLAHGDLVGKYQDMIQGVEGLDSAIKKLVDFDPDVFQCGSTGNDTYQLDVKGGQYYVRWVKAGYIKDHGGESFPCLPEGQAGLKGLTGP